MSEENVVEDKKAQPQKPETLGGWQKILAGFLLIVFLLAPAYYIVAYWPDRIPDPKDGVRPLYVNKPFHVSLVCVPDTPCCIDTFFVHATITGKYADKVRIADSAIAADSARAADSAKSAGKAKAGGKATAANTPGLSDTGKTPGSPTKKPEVTGQATYYLISDLIDLNILLLMLVAAGGFLGNMIYVATSFTTFVGADKFNRSWLLWYFVKPFTAAGLALGLYFVFRAGFLSYSASASGINPYGVETVAILAGLFTDKATLKLKEIFDVVFTLKNKDSRPGTLAQPFKFISATPAKLSRVDKNTIVITGQCLDQGTFHFKINNQVIAKDQITTSTTNIAIAYSAAAVPADQTSVLLVVTDDQDKIVFQQTFTF